MIIYYITTLLNPSLALTYRAVFRGRKVNQVEILWLLLTVVGLVISTVTIIYRVDTLRLFLVYRLVVSKVAYSVWLFP